MSQQFQDDYDLQAFLTFDVDQFKRYKTKGNYVKNLYTKYIAGEDEPKEIQIDFQDKVDKKLSYVRMARNGLINHQ